MIQCHLIFALYKLKISSHCLDVFSILCSVSFCRFCVNQCIKNGCVGDKCFPYCNISSNSNSISSPWYMQEPLHFKWKQLNCLGDCRYYCMIDREKERQSLGHEPVKYHGKWPFKRVFGLQVCQFIV